MPAPTIDGRLLCACNAVYAANPGGTLPADLYYNGAGFLAPPTTFLSKDGLDACLVGQTNDGVVLAFRGTLAFDIHDPTSLRDWLQDFDGKPVPPTWLPAGSSACAHDGFLRSLESLWPSLEPAVTALLQTAGARNQLFVTGHSKGGAAAPLAALRFSVTANFKSTVVTFAAPHVGDRAFADRYNNAPIVHTRYENTDDIVPHVPPTIDGFLDVLDEFAPWLAQDLADIPCYDYEPLGALRFIDWDGDIVNDSTALETRRWFRLSARILSNHWEFIPDDHSIVCGSGYMSAICPTGVCPD